MNNDKKIGGPSGCEREEDLIAYLYDEVSIIERASFERHLEDCASCRSELKAFGRVRDDLTTWQVGFSPRTEIALPKRRLDILRELTNLFPVWARGAALTAAAASLLLFALSFTGSRINLKGSEPSATPGQVEALINQAIAKERGQLQNEFRAQMAAYKQQIEAEREGQIETLSAVNRAKLEAIRASLRAEIKRSNRQNSSIRSFFAMDENQDPWGDVK